MKIGLVCPYNIAKGGGVQEIVLATRDELVKRGYEVRIITPKPRKRHQGNLPGVIYVGKSTDLKSPMHTLVQVSASNDAEKVDEMLSEEKFDVLHFHEPWVPMSSLQILQRSTSVNIATFHAKVPETLMSRTVIKVVNPYLKSVLKYLDEITAVSDSAKDYVSSLTNQTISIIPNGIDLEKYKYIAKSHDLKAPKTIFYIGRLERRKGLKYLLQAFQILSEKMPDVKLVIAGDGPDREKLEVLAESLKLRHVKFLGFVSEEMKLKLMSEADLFCSPAIFGESFGIVLLEAMATGTPCVAGDNSGYSDLMQGVGAISITNTLDISEFARRLELLLIQPEIRKLWQVWALEYVKQFNYTSVVDMYERLYISSVSKHAKR